MSEFKLRFVHVVSTEPLTYKRKDKDSDETFRQNTASLARRAERSALLQEMYDNADISAELMPDYGYDLNTLRRYTYVYTFPHAKDGDFDTVAIAFARQANGDQFMRKFGREVATNRLALLLTEQRAKFRVDYGPFAQETKVDTILDRPGFIPEKVVYAIVKSRKALKKANS